MNRVFARGDMKNTQDCPGNSAKIRTKAAPDTLNLEILVSAAIPIPFIDDDVPHKLSETSTSGYAQSVFGKAPAAKYLMSANAKQCRLIFDIHLNQRNTTLNGVGLMSSTCSFDNKFQATKRLPN